MSQTKLSLLEQETIILFNREEKEAEIYTCIFRCGGAAVPEIWKPPVRNWKPLLQSFTHLSSYLIHIIHALKCLSKDQCFQY